MRNISRQLFEIFFARGSANRCGSQANCGRESHRGRLCRFLPGSLPLSSLPALAATLYPGREHPGVYTAAELWIISNTMFHFLFRYALPGVPRTLGDDMATFMIWVTFPSTLLVPKLLQVLRGGLFELRGDECIWLSDQVLNFSFSPRSALLMFTFGLSIRLQQGLSNPLVRPHVDDHRPPTFLDQMEHFA